MQTITEEGFWDRADRSGGPTACWNWLGYLNDHGYGMVRMRNRPRRAHRVAYEFVAGDIPHGKMILHSCDNRRCVNPAHLRVGTALENIHDAKNRGRMTQGSFNRRKTHCSNGHEFTPENTRMSKRGQRHCLACNRLYKRRKTVGADRESASGTHWRG